MPNCLHNHLSPKTDQAPLRKAAGTQQASSCYFFLLLLNFSNQHYLKCISIMVTSSLKENIDEKVWFLKVWSMLA